MLAEKLTTGEQSKETLIKTNMDLVGNLERLRRHVMAKNKTDAENVELKKTILTIKKEVDDLRRQTMAKNKTDAENVDLKKTILTMKKEVDDLTRQTMAKNQTDAENVELKKTILRMKKGDVELKPQGHIQTKESPSHEGYALKDFMESPKQKAEFPSRRRLPQTTNEKICNLAQIIHTSWWNNIPEIPNSANPGWHEARCVLCNSIECLSNGPRHYSRADIESKLAPIEQEYQSLQIWNSNNPDIK
jgi:hypothetical protein